MMRFASWFRRAVQMASSPRAGVHLPRYITCSSLASNSLPFKMKLRPAQPDKLRRLKDSRKLGSSCDGSCRLVWDRRVSAANIQMWTRYVVLRRGAPTPPDRFNTGYGRFRYEVNGTRDGPPYSGGVEPYTVQQHTAWETEAKSRRLVVDLSNSNILELLVVFLTSNTVANPSSDQEQPSTMFRKIGIAALSLLPFSLAQISSDFESGWDQTTWATYAPDCNQGGTVSLDKTKAHSGSNSIKVAGAGGYCGHAFFGTTKVPSGDVYVRVWM